MPNRGEVIWIDHNPQAGRERKDHHPFLVLSTAPFHAAVGLLSGVQREPVLEITGQMLGFVG